MKPIDISGERYGRLVAICRVRQEARQTFWRFACDCGETVERRLDHVRMGKTLSCDCLLREVTAARSITHGHSVGRRVSRELSSYNKAKSRCQNPNDAKFPQYGKRGIRMCEAWSNDASQFLLDMGPCPPGHTIDRIDPHGNYEPGNCRWATAHQQARTRTDNVIVEYQGAQMVLKDYAQLLGISYKRLHARLRRGMSLEQASAP